jgi:Mrp family chromosome partitioning ATPase
MNEASLVRGPAPLFTAAGDTARARRVPAVDSLLMHSLAVHAMDAGTGGRAAVGIASVLHGEGATTIACSMAACVAKTLGQRVVLVDANQRSPALREVFGLPPGPGLGDVLRGNVPLEKALCLPAAGPSGEGRLLVMPASVDLRIPMGQMAGIMHELTAALLSYAELLVFDLAPLNPYPDSALLGRHLDGVVVVLQAERAKWDTSDAAIQSLRDGGAKTLGAVLNRRRNYLPRFLEQML